MTYLFAKLRETSKKKQKTRYKMIKHNLKYFGSLYKLFRLIDVENTQDSLKKIQKLTVGQLREPLKSRINDTISGLESGIMDVPPDLIDILEKKYNKYQKRFNELPF
jgi:hypothetical protein